MILQNTVGKMHVNIVDWEGSSPEVRSDLLKAALTWGRFRNVSTWGATLTEPVIEVLQHAGFTAAGNTNDMTHRDGQFLLKSLGGHDTRDIHSGQQLLEPGHWDLRMIYSDSE